jgi:hypothetical protein
MGFVPQPQEGMLNLDRRPAAAKKTPR